MIRKNKTLNEMWETFVTALPSLSNALVLISLVFFVYGVLAVKHQAEAELDLTETDLIEHILAFADPTGYETPGLYQDLSGYFPTKDQWSILRDYRTAQSLEISTLGVPESWPAIAAESANEIADGTVAVTITGTRTRTGGWNGEQSAKTYPVEFTMFVSCPESGRCSVLRLSQLGAALH